MTARLARIRTVLVRVNDSLSFISHKVVSAEGRALFGLPQSAYYNHLEAAESTSRALERSILLVEQLRILRLAVLNGWNGPLAAKSEGHEIQDLALRSCPRMRIVRSGVLAH